MHSHSDSGTRGWSRGVFSPNPSLPTRKAGHPQTYASFAPHSAPDALTLLRLRLGHRMRLVFYWEFDQVARLEAGGGEMFVRAHTLPESGVSLLWLSELGNSILAS